MPPKNKKNTSEEVIENLVETVNESPLLTAQETVKELEFIAAPAQYNNIPPFSWSRNEYGLLNHVNYVFNEDGSVNWRAMVPDKYLVPNKQNFERRKKPIPQSIEGLEDKDLLILLDGIKYLAAIRGVTNINQQPELVSENYVAVKTTVTFIPNYESGGKEVRYSDLADAATFNTSSFAKYYLNAIAANRGFVRAIRNALRLPIIAFDEIGETPKEEEVKENPSGPLVILNKKLNEKNISFEKLKYTCLKRGGFENADKWESVNDISIGDIYKIIESIKEKEKDKEVEKN